MLWDGGYIDQFCPLIGCLMVSIYFCTRSLILRLALMSLIYDCVHLFN
jgi:hypothetical protein